MSTRFKAGTPSLKPMPASPDNEGRRALDRTRQLALEGRAAARSGDLDALGRVMRLMPGATERLAATVGGAADARAIAEVRRLHAETEELLERQLADVATQLRKCAAARRSHRSLRWQQPQAGRLDRSG